MGNYGVCHGLGVRTCAMNVLGEFSLGFVESRRNLNLLTQRDRFEVKCVVNRMQIGVKVGIVNVESVPSGE